MNKDFIENKWSRIYYSIVENARNGIRIEGENHHIVPVSLGGNNDKNNIVRLTHKEHYICHMLLLKMFERSSVSYKKMAYAFNITKGRLGAGNSVINEMGNKAFKEVHSNRVVTQETRDKMAKARTGTTASDATKKKMSELRKGYVHPEEDKLKIGRKGLVMYYDPINEKSYRLKPDDDLIKELNLVQKQKWRYDNGELDYLNKKGYRQLKVVKCPHCGKEGKGGNMTRYHFDNCKGKKV